MNDLKRMRLSVGTTQKELAQLAGVSQSLVARIENNRVDASYSRMKRIMEALGELKKPDRNISLSDLVTKNVVYVRASEKIAKAAKIMKSRNISQLPVVDGEKIVGTVSEKEISQSILEKRSLLVKDIMTDALPIISVNTDTAVLLHILDHNPAVLVSRNGKISGIVTRADMLKMVNY